MVWKKRDSPKKYLKGQIFLSFILVVVLALVALFVWIAANNQVAIQPTSEIPEQTEVVEEPQPAEAPEVTFDKVSIQAVVDDWVASVDGVAAVVVSQTNGGVLASHNPERSFFAASIYKLFVAYEGYLQLDRGEVNPSEVYINGATRAECLDTMVRTSDSPCAEKLLAELGNENITDTLAGYDITNTSMTNITTTAGDAAKILVRIANGQGLTASSQQALLESMRVQIYRDALNKGFSTDSVVYNKIGFRELVEYHDVAFVDLSDGQQLIVSVFTENIGTKNIARLGELLEKAVE